jgi:hypothetical protein
LVFGHLDGRTPWSAPRESQIGKGGEDRTIPIDAGETLNQNAADEGSFSMPRPIRAKLQLLTAWPFRDGHQLATQAKASSAL